LCAKLNDKTLIEGESNIDVPQGQRSPISQVFLNPAANINLEAKEEIFNADMVIIGPGDLYTSLVPNLLVNGMKEALSQTNAKLVYVCNLMTKKGETDDFLASDFLKEIEVYAGRKIDYIICNENGIKASLIQKYRQEEQYPVIFDLVKDERAILSSLVYQPTLIRHDPVKLAREIIRLF
jgi:uncharacterized cofD-like protein